MHLPGSDKVVLVQCQNNREVAKQNKQYLCMYSMISHSAVSNA